MDRGSSTWAIVVLVAVAAVWPAVALVGTLALVGGTGGGGGVFTFYSELFAAVIVFPHLLKLTAPAAALLIAFRPRPVALAAGLAALPISIAAVQELTESPMSRPTSLTTVACGVALVMLAVAVDRLHRQPAEV